MSLAGTPPVDLGKIDITASEMMFWMYLPISVPNDYSYQLPDNLRQFDDIVAAVLKHETSAFFLRYAYLTVKTLWVSGDYIGNRPGWHIDGYGTSDVNYIWADRAPTEFLVAPYREVGDGASLWTLSDDCDISMQEMATIADDTSEPQHRFFFPDRHLLRLDNRVIHRSPVDFAPGMRTFVKVSLSHDRYNLKGNSVNHLLPATHWPLVDRAIERNHPAA